MGLVVVSRLNWRRREMKFAVCASRYQDFVLRGRGFAKSSAAQARARHPSIGLTGRHNEPLPTHLLPPLLGLLHHALVVQRVKWNTAVAYSKIHLKCIALRSALDLEHLQIVQQVTRRYRIMICTIRKCMD